MSSLDTFTKHLPTTFNQSDKNKKFIYISGEVADFYSSLSANENQWAIGYNKFSHPRFLRQPSCVLDVWTMFDEARVVDSPLNWLTEKRNFEQISSRNKKFCCITQASNNDFRGKIFDKLGEYKNVDSSGPWRQNLTGSDTLNKYQWMSSLYEGRIDGLTYREKIDFFKKYKFNIAIHYTFTDYIVQEKIFHSFFAGCIPIYYGNKYIYEEGFNPYSFINLHNYTDLNVFLEHIKEIYSNVNLYKKYIEEPIFVNNKIPEYFDFDYTLDFLEKIIES
jgi:hypothetical protein